MELTRTPPQLGGETTICDGIDVVDHLPKEVRQEFESRRLLYMQPLDDEESQIWLGTKTPSPELLQNPPEDCPYGFAVHPESGRIHRYFTAPALHQPMFSQKRAFGNFLLFARFGLDNRDFPSFSDGERVSDELMNVVKRISDQLTAPVMWQKGDLVVLDNTRFMHGRNEITNTNERLILTYFEYLKFAQPSSEEPANARWRKPHNTTN